MKLSVGKFSERPFDLDIRKSFGAIITIRIDRHRTHSCSDVVGHERMAGLVICGNLEHDELDLFAEAHQLAGFGGEVQAAAGKREAVPHRRRHLRGLQHLAVSRLNHLHGAVLVDHKQPPVAG